LDSEIILFFYFKKLKFPHEAAHTNLRIGRNGTPTIGLKMKIDVSDFLEEDNLPPFIEGQVAA
jgi:hypothetical protein